MNLNIEWAFKHSTNLGTEWNGGEGASCSTFERLLKHSTDIPKRDDVDEYAIRDFS